LIESASESLKTKGGSEPIDGELLQTIIYISMATVRPLALAGVHQPMAGGLAALLPTIGGGLPLRPATPTIGGESWLLKI
jgi:hypothetical protein